MTEPEDLDPADNNVCGATGGVYAPDTRTAEERERDERRARRKRRVSVWVWRLRGLLPRGWKDSEDDE